MSAANPFLVIQQSLYSQIYLPGGPGTLYEINLNVLVVLVAISMLFNFLAVVGRFLNGSSIWIFRLSRNKYGSFILPHSVLTWTISSFIFGILLQFYINAARQNGRIGSDLHGLIMWRSSIWFPLWLAAYFLAWSTALQSLITPTHEFGSRFDPARHPKIVNILFFAIPITFASISQTFAALASHHFDLLFETFVQVDGELTIAAANVAAGQAPTNTILIQQLIAEIGIQRPQFVNNWRGLWITSDFFVIIEAAVFITGAIVYFKTLQKSIDLLKQQKNIRQFQSLERSYQSLVLTCFATLFIEACYFCVNIFVSTKTNEIVNASSMYAVVATLLAVYIYSILGLLVNTFILLRSFSAKKKGTTSMSFGGSTSGSIVPVNLEFGKVEVRHVTAVDFDQAEEFELSGSRKRESQRIHFV